jgi:TolB-like protein
MSGRTVAFGPFVFNRDNGTLLRNGAPVPIGQKGALLLEALLSQPGAVRTKVELLDAAWPGMALEESNLSVQMASLRKQLGPAPGNGEWIATVPRVGYRFVGKTETSSMMQSGQPILPSLAVMPFQNMSGDPKQEYFADGIVEDIITALSRFRSFAVIARNSSFVYKGKAVDVRQIAEELGVRYILEGSVRRSAGKLRITAQLIDATTGAHLWADKFDGAVEDVFDVQDRITESVVGIVEPQIRRAEIERSRRKHPQSLDAYDLYLRALARLYTMRPEDNAAVYAQMMTAIGLEPNYAPFLTNAVWALQFRLNMGWPSLTGDDRAACLELVRRALASADNDAPVLAQCGIALAMIGREYEYGLHLIEDAVAANPNNQYMQICAAVAKLHCGNLEESIGHSRRAIVMSPRDPLAEWPMTAIAHAYMALGDYSEALQAAERSYAFNPDYDPTYWMLIAANAKLGRMDEARRWLDKFRRLMPGVTIANIRDGQPAYDPSRMAAILEGLRMAGLEE